MFYRYIKTAFNYATITKNHIKSFIIKQSRNPYLKIVALSSLPAYFYCDNLLKTLEQQETNIQIEKSKKCQEQLQKSKNATFWQQIKSVMSHIIRFLQLAFIFLPPIITYPLRFFKITQKVWIKLFVNSVEGAGVVWIKAFQYLSHRRDIIGSQMAQSFVHLRENAPQHSFQQTKQNFRQAYGKNIEDIFQKFDPKPIASGSVSQVYQAVFKGKKVAVKVRHPEVDKYIERDMNILFGISQFLSIFSKSYQIPIGFNSLKKTLIDQIDFNVEKDNLVTFKKHFQNNNDVNVPDTFQNESKESILIESFIEGVPITYFEQNKHPLNSVIARLGTYTFFQMLMKNNFVHADCHGGNILVQVSPNSTSFFDEIQNYLNELWYKLQWKITQKSIESDKLRNLYKSSWEEEDKTRKIVRKSLQKIKITLIDAGMVIKLSQPDRRNFMNFLKSVVQGNSKNIATTVYGLSNFNGRKLREGQFESYKKQLQECFTILESSTIFQVKGMNLLLEMLNIVRDNHMKLDGQMATLLTNMVVLQSIAREIDPEIHLLKCAIPYFKLIHENNRQIQNYDEHKNSMILLS